jgi:hypothetical protein
LLSFTFDGRNLEVVKEIFYLGLIFSVSGSFLSTKKALINKSNKAMYEVLKKGRLHNLSVKGQYDLFDKIVKPILLYGCEIWGFSNIELLESIHSLIGLIYQRLFCTQKTSRNRKNKTKVEYFLHNFKVSPIKCKTKQIICESTAKDGYFCLVY